jgi:nucleotide-binding universal stress UspA family protein
VNDHPIVACYRDLDSADAVTLGAMLASAIDLPLVLAHAYRYEPIAHSARALPAPANDRRAAAAQQALRRARTFAGADVEISERAVPSARIADALVDLAREVDASVLVVGRDTAGHVTRGLLPRAPCPVAVAPLGEPLPAASGFERIGVAYDGSPPARWALSAASAIARLTGGRLVLLAAGATAEDAATYLQMARLKVDDAVRHEVRGLVGDAARVLTAATDDLDLLVCGSRGRGRPRAMVFGSVSTQLVANARCAVLVIPPGVAHNPSGPLGLTTAAA